MASGTVPSLAVAPVGLAVALSAFYGGFGPGLFALTQATLALDLLVIEPGSLVIFSRRPEAMVLWSCAAGWLVFCVLAERRLRSVRQDHSVRLAAERTARQADRLEQLTAALVQARTPQDVVEATVQEGLYALRADAGMLLLVDHERRRAEVVRAVSYPEPYAPDVTLSHNDPVSDTVSRGVPVIVESRAEYSEGAAPPDGLFATTVAVPLVSSSRVAAVVRLDFRGNRSFAAEDREYLLALGARAAQALDRTRQLEEAERARAEAEALRARADRELSERRSMERALRASEALCRSLAARTARLHTLSSALSGAASLDAVARVIVAQGRAAVGAAAGEVALLEEGNAVLVTLYAEPERVDGQPGRLALVEGLCATEVIRTARPVFVGSFAEWQERYWRSASMAADGGHASSASMPLVVDGTPIGVLAFHFTAPVSFDEEFRTLLSGIAQHCAQALDRSRLYEATQRAREEAERANRGKDEFVSIVSHELRSPLNAILGWVSILQSESLDAAKTARALQAVRDNATRQARLIEELLEFARMASGRTVLEVETFEIRKLLRGVVESMIPAALARGVHLQLSAVPPLHLTGDIRRLEQVFVNLIDNALKFTSKDGRVSIDVRLRGERVEIHVRDDGLGIDPEFLPFVFEKFRQADAATGCRHGGLGLGLSIARQLVEAHGGTIAAESAGRGYGATFVASLPLAPPSTRALPPGAASETGQRGLMAPPCPAPRIEGDGDGAGQVDG